MTNSIGEIAGVLTAFFWAANAVVITRAGNQVGSVISNRTRIIFALLYLMIINLILFQQPLPFDADRSRWLWLSLSGVIGLALGDAFLFQSYILIGPRLGTLILSSSTIVGALEAWIFFGETLRLGQMIGIALTLAGIIWVIMQRSPNTNTATHHAASGLIFGILAAVCQATGLVLSKQGMTENFSPFQANAIRMFAAMLALFVIMVLQKETSKTINALRENKSALKLLALAALIGPVLGVSLSLVAVQNAEVGVASVLTSLSPIFMIPFSRFLLKEQLNWQSIAGTIIAMVGVAILFLV